MIMYSNHHPHCRIKTMILGGSFNIHDNAFCNRVWWGWLDLPCLDWSWLLTVYVGLGGYLKLEMHPGWFNLISLLALLLKNSVKDNKISIHKNECSDITITYNLLTRTGYCIISRNSHLHLIILDYISRSKHLWKDKAKFISRGGI